MSRWDGEQWSAAQYLLTSSSAGYNEDGPDWLPRSEDWGWDDIGLVGAGPDTVAVPDTSQPGQYRLCTAPAGDASDCVNLAVVAGT